MTGYHLDDRTAQDFRHDVAELARSRPVAGLTGTDWNQLLFDGDDFRDETEPSQALMATALDQLASLGDHLNTLPEKALKSWLENRLGISPLPELPEKVIATVEAKPEALPVVIPQGSSIKTGDDRVFATAAPLTALGATLVGAKAYHRDDPADYAAEWDDLEAPFDPFDEAAATHRLRIVSDLLVAEAPGDGMTVTLLFTGAEASDVSGLTWWASTPDGMVNAAVTRVAGAELDLRITGSCGPLEVHGESLTFLEADAAGLESNRLFAFHPTEIKLRVNRQDVVPDGAAFNDGTVDISKEFQPFGPTPKRGDSFYIHSDEAFGKPIASLTVRLALLSEPTGHNLRDVVWSASGQTPYQSSQLSQIQAQFAQSFIDAPELEVAVNDLFRQPTNRAAVKWERRLDGAWWKYDEPTSNLPAVQTTDDIGSGAAAMSDRTTVAGLEGHYIRAFLSEGDFGWQDYLDNVAKFAADAAAQNSPSASLLKPPNPVVVTSVSISYTTPSLAPDQLRMYNGHEEIVVQGKIPGVPPFHQQRVDDTVDGTKPTGYLAFGLDVAESVLGSTLALFIDVEPATACFPGLLRRNLEWQYWGVTSDDSKPDWHVLEVNDGTFGLRQGGVLRAVTPFGWVDGSDALGASSGRWLRAWTDAPQLLGTVRVVIPDAVECELSSDHPAGGVPLQPDELKAFLPAIAGIKKVSNPLPGIAGRPKEPDASFTSRAVNRSRHRNRGIQPWDYERIVLSEWPEIAVARCLPHKGPDGGSAPGHVGLVVIPQSKDAMPLPNVRLAEDLQSKLQPRMPVHAELAVLCPLYVPVSVDVTVRLKPGIAAATARGAVEGAIEAFLHPLEVKEPRFGVPLFASSLVALIEGLPEVDLVASYDFAGDFRGASRVTVDPCRGLFASAGGHVLNLEEQL